MCRGGSIDNFHAKSVVNNPACKTPRETLPDVYTLGSHWLVPSDRMQAHGSRNPNHGRLSTLAVRFATALSQTRDNSRF